MGGGGLLGGITGALFGSPQQVAVPDYAAAAEATAAGNRVNQVTPYGNLTYEQTGTDSKGNPIWTATTSLSDVGQQLLDQQNAASLGLGGTINAALENVQGTMGQPFAPNLPNIQSSIAIPEYERVGGGPSFTSVGQAAQNLQVGQGPQFNQIGNAPQLQTGVSGTGMEGWDAATKLIMNRLQPQLERQNAQSDAQLANQGIMPGSEAYKVAKSQLAQNQNDLLTQAQLAGQQVQNSMFNQNLAAGQFGNEALLGQNQAQLSNLGFNNLTGQQSYQNQLAAQQANNAAINQNLQNAIAATGFNNQMNQQGYQNQLAAQAANNQAISQGTQAQLANANLANAANQQAYAQALTNYNMPLNTLSALRSGAQVQNPTFQNTPAGADYLTAAGLTNQGNIANANAANAATNSMLGGLFGLGGAGILKYSDIRTKENIKPIGWLPNGLPVYEFEYKDEWKDKAGHGTHIGVMAQEVEKVLPEAVITRPDGYKMVNYALLG